MDDLDLEALDLLGELDALGVVERLVVLVYVGQVEYLAKELDDWLALVVADTSMFKLIFHCDGSTG